MSYILNLANLIAQVNLCKKNTWRTYAIKLTEYFTSVTMGIDGSFVVMQASLEPNPWWIQSRSRWGT